MAGLKVCGAVAFVFAGLFAQAAMANGDFIFRYRTALVDRAAVGAPEGPGSPGTDGPGNGNPSGSGDPGGGGGPGGPEGGATEDPGTMSFDTSEAGAADPSNPFRVLVPKGNPDTFDYVYSDHGTASLLVTGTTSGVTAQLVKDSMPSGHFNSSFTSFVLNGSDVGAPGLAMVVLDVDAEYRDAGTYPVTLKILDEAGHVLSANFNIVVVPKQYAPLAADMSGWATSVDLDDAGSHPYGSHWAHSAIISGGVPPFKVSGPLGRYHTVEADSFLKRDLDSNGRQEIATAFSLSFESRQPMVRIWRTADLGSWEDQACVLNGVDTVWDAAVGQNVPAISYDDVGFTVTDSVGASVTVPAMAIKLSVPKCSNASAYPTTGNVGNLSVWSW